MWCDVHHVSNRATATTTSKRYLYRRSRGKGSVSLALLRRGSGPPRTRRQALEKTCKYTRLGCCGYSVSQLGCNGCHRKPSLSLHKELSDSALEAPSNYGSKQLIQGAEQQGLGAQAQKNKTRPPTTKVAWGFSQNDYGSTCNSRDAHKTINMNPTSTVIRYQSNRPLSTSN